MLNTPEDVKAPKQPKSNIKVENTEIVIDKQDDWSIVVSSEWNISLTQTETKEEIVKRYIEKFQKKPFAWWSKEVLLSKMN